MTVFSRLTEVQRKSVLDFALAQEKLTQTPQRPGKTPSLKSNAGTKRLGAFDSEAGGASSNPTFLGSSAAQKRKAAK